MNYTNSELVSYTNLTSNHSGRRTHEINRITPHCVVGQWSAKKIADFFKETNRKTSCNYGIGTEGKISLVVEEKNRSWCSSSNDNDQRAITIECASDANHPYKMNSKVYESLINLCVDICKRNGKKKLLWLGNKEASLSYVPEQDEMILTVHRWFANKSCPGDWLYSRLDDLANKVTEKLNGGVLINELYCVQIGAFKKEANAKAMLNKVKAKGFDAIIVKADGFYKVQVGAYAQKANASNMMMSLKSKGFNSFITTKLGEPVTVKKSVDEIAREVIRGDWGNGDIRKARLKAAGYDYYEVQSRVNELLR